MALASMRAVHDTDPRDAILSKLSQDVLSNFTLFHNQILVATYIRPSKTASGLYLPDSTINEDRFQGKVGLVLLKGPLAFEDDERVKFRGQAVEIGDWLVFRPSDGWNVAINGVDCRVLSDTDVKMAITSPDIVF